MAAKSAAGLLTSVDSMFTTQEERDNAQRSYVIDLPTTEISDFPDHPFKVRMDEEMEQMVESVRERGVLSPVLVRPMPDGGYQMVSGHRRKFASELAELPTVPCIVRELTDDEAIIIMVDSNLQREQVLPSEKAFAYKMKLDAMRRQAGRPSKNNSVPVGQNFGQTSREVLASNSPDSNTQIQRYIRLTNLTPELLDMVDNSVLKEKDKLQMALRPAVELSYLSKDEQNAFTATYDRALYNAIRQTLVDGTSDTAPAYTMVGDSEYSAVKNLLGRMEGFVRYEHHVPENFVDYWQHLDYFAVSAAMPENYQAPFDFIQPIIAETAELDTDSEKVEYLNDYLCTLLAYKKGKTAGVTRTFAQHSGELQAACGSYARAFKFLCGAAGIPCFTISTDKHTWNMVYADGQWLHVDVSLNDLTSSHSMLLRETYADHHRV